MGRVQHHFAKYLDDTIFNVKETNEDILFHFKKQDFRTRIFGIPLEIQNKMKIDEDVKEETNDENLAARAILVKIFASDLIPIFGEDRE